MGAPPPPRGEASWRDAFEGARNETQEPLQLTLYIIPCQHLLRWLWQASLLLTWLIAASTRLLGKQFLKVKLRKFSLILLPVGPHIKRSCVNNWMILTTTIIITRYKDVQRSQKKETPRFESATGAYFCGLSQCFVSRNDPNPGLKLSYNATHPGMHRICIIHLKLVPPWMRCASNADCRLTLTYP